MQPQKVKSKWSSVAKKSSVAERDWPYFISFLHKFNRSLFPQFRTGVLPIGIETGCYHLNENLKSTKLKRCFYLLIRAHTSQRQQ